MAKKISASTKKRRLGETWTGADHLERASKKARPKSSHDDKKNNQMKKKKKDLSHDTQIKRDERKLYLHITHTKRQVERLKQRLEQWDDVVEEGERLKKEQQQKLEEQRQATTAERTIRVRPGPETWKLRGAARPAWEVYDFDVRYVDPHVKAHDDARAKVQRCRNVLLLYKQQFHTNQAPSQCRDYLTLLMRLALLYREAGNIKACRTVLLDCMELDSKEYPISLARCYLMRLYIQANRFESVQRLCNKVSHQDHSCWIQYTRVLLEYRNNKDDTKDHLSSVHDVLQQAIQYANIYCALYLAFGTIFDSVMEYADEIQDAIADDEPLEEAIEYCNSEQRQLWEQEDGALPWLRNTILTLLKNKKQLKHNHPHDDDNKTDDTTDDNSKDDDHLNWKLKLQQMEDAAHAAQAIAADARASIESQEDDDGKNKDDDSNIDNNTEDDDESVVDVLMFIVMFRTAMEMVEEKYGL